MNASENINARASVGDTLSCSYTRATLCLLPKLPHVKACCRFLCMYTKLPIRATLSRCPDSPHEMILCYFSALLAHTTRYAFLTRSLPRYMTATAIYDRNIPRYTTATARYTEIHEYFPLYQNSRISQNLGARYNVCDI
jgi:hypothetical protein